MKCTPSCAPTGRSLPGIRDLLITAFVTLTLSTATAQVPDLTAGGSPGDTAYINLGPTGMEGWFYNTSSGNMQETLDARQILVTKVDAGSPADGVLAVDDVILGVDGTGEAPENFIYDARRALADAIDAAEGNDPAELKLLRWRSGVTSTVSITLEYLGGSYSATAPFNCAKSAAILEKGLEYIMSSEPGSGYAGFGTTVLLAANDPSNPDNAARQARAQAEAYALNLTQEEIDDMTSGDLSRALGKPWSIGPQLIAQAEYYLQTGDSAVLPSIRARAIQIANGQSLFGTMGHSYALPGPNGEVNSAYGIGYGPVNNAGMPCFLGLILAEKCGLTDPEILDGIARSAKYFQYYADLGTVPYGENKETGSIANNGKSALAALTLSMVDGYDEEAKYFTKLSTFGAKERDSGHTGPYFNQLWTPLGSNLGGPDSMSHYFNTTSWLYDLSRRWDGGFVYHPYYQSGGIKVYGQAHRASWTTLLTYAAPLEQIHITGKNANPALAFDVTDIADIDHAMDYDPTSRTTAELIDDLKSPFPQLHWSAGSEIGANRTADHTSIIPTLIDMANNAPTYAEQHGAIYALNQIADDSTASDLSSLLFSTNSKVRYMAANALKNLSMAAKTAEITSVVNALVANDRPLLPLDPENPMHVDTQAIGQLLFNSDKGIWGNSRVTSADRNLLYPAFRIIATAPMGRTRDAAFSVAHYLTKEDVEALADVLVEVATNPPPGEITYGNRSGAITAMQINDFAEGVPAAIIAFEGVTKQSAKYDILALLEDYGASSLTVNPDPDVVQFTENLLTSSDSYEVEAQAVLDSIAHDPLPAVLKPFKSIDWIFADDPNLTLPEVSTVLRLSWKDFAKGEPSFTWRKVHGAGEVTFAPNGTPAAEATTVVFDGTPGVYTFEVTMSDAIGLTETSKTVTVNLYETGGTLPSNTAPTANNQSVTVGQGAPTQLILSGTDPEGLDLVYSITSGPSHGYLSGEAPYLVYTADPDYTGSDSITFEVIDSEGEVTSATINITVDAVSAVGVAIYEPFDYPAGPFDGSASTTEVGLDGAWESDDLINVIGGSLDYGPLPTAGGSISSLNSDTEFGGARAINPAALAGNGLLDDGATLWFSAVVGHPGSNYRQWFHFALANDKFGSGKNFYIMDDGVQMGSGVGLTVSESKALAVHYRDSSFGDQSESHVRGTWSDANGSLGSYGHRLAVGKITWGASSDTIEIYLPGEDLILPSTPSSVLTVNVDQSTFDTLTFARSGVPLLDEVRFGSSYHSVLQGNVAMTGDVTTPTPDPMTFSSVPAVSSASSITMTATPAFDDLGVEYYFTCTAGGGNDSGWQDSNVYTDSGLTPGVQYSYTVKARDKQPGLNETSASAAASAMIPSLATVPNLVGIPQSTAEALVLAADLNVGTITTASAYSLDVPAGHVLSQSPAAGSTAAYGSALDLEISIGQDPILPTLVSTDIVDDQNGGPVVVNTLMSYTVTFSEDMDAATLDAADFTNAGDAAVTIGNIVETSPGVVTVEVTPTSMGILRFAVAEGAAILDAQGSALNTTLAIVDDTVITINLPDEIVPAVTGLAQATAEANIIAANLAVGTVREMYHETIAQGEVISQDPVGGSSLPGLYPVDLVVSLGTPPDITGPVIVSTDPADADYNVQVDAVLTVSFDEWVFLNSGSIVLRNLNDGTDMIIPVTDAAQVSTYAEVLVIDPAVDLVAGKSYAVRIAPGAVVDASGNEFAGINDSWTWNFSTSLTPLETVLFTEDFESPDVAAYSKGTFPVDWVGGTYGFGGDKHGMTDKAGGDFSASDPNHQGYAFRYANSGLTSAEGVLATIAEGVTYQVTFDVVRDDGMNAGTSYWARLLAFDSVPNAGRKDARGSAPGVELVRTNGDARSDGFFSTASFQYTVPVGDPAIGQDLTLRFLGAASSAIIDNVVVKTVRPYVGDQVPPVVASLTPTDDSQQVSLTDNLRLIFDEDVVIGAGFITLKDLTTGAETAINALDELKVFLDGSVLEINPDEDLNTNTFYSVQIEAGLITDLAGNPFPGITDDITWTFNTGETDDITAPQVQALSPVDGATGVSYSTALTMTFNENVVVNSGSITLKNLSDATEVVIDVTDSNQVVAAGPTVTITPSTYMGEGKNYAVQVDAGAILDLSGNAHAGIADDVTWNFTTSAINPPAIASFNPADEEVNVDIAASLSVTFDEDIAAGTGNITLRNVNTSSDLLIDVNDGTQVSISGPTLTIDLSADLAEAANYAILIDSGAVEDLAGNPFAGISSDATWNFVTGVSSAGLVFFDDFEVSSGSPDVDAAGSGGNTNKQTGPNWVRSSGAFGSDRHGLVDESSGQYTDPSGEQAYAFRYTNSGLTTAEGMIGTLQSGKVYRVTFNVVGDGYNNGGTYDVGLVTFDTDAARSNVVRMADNTSMVLATKDGNFSGSSYQLVSFEYVSNGVDDAAVLGHDLAIRLDGGTNTANIDNVQITINDSATDIVPPTLSGSDIVDDQSGGSVEANTLVNYTVTFSEDMDAATVDASDFTNAGTSAITVGSVSEALAGVFSVQVTPTTTGSLQLQVPAGAVLTDVAGNALDTASVIVDDTTITVTTPNLAPVWATDPVDEVTATRDVAYSSTLSDDASDGNGDAMTFAKVNGPAWLDVATNGDLSGTPGSADVGANAFTVSASDGIASPVEATLDIAVINVNDAPVWHSDPVVEVDGDPDQLYSSSLADDVTDVDGDSLTFAKVSGPAWLAVATDGTLSGTPLSANVGANNFVVSVSDGIAAAVEAALDITVIDPFGPQEIFSESFENPDVLDDVSTDPIGWVTTEHANYINIVDENDSSPKFTSTPYGEQALSAFQKFGANATTTASILNEVVTAGTTYTLSFNASAELGRAKGEYTVTLLAVDGVGNETVLGLVTGETDATYDMSYGDSFEVIPTTNFGERLAIRLQHTVDANWQNKPVFDNILLVAEVNNTAPAWTSDPVNESDATEDALYTSTLSDDASDADGNPLTYMKVSGPAWLSVAGNGDLSGTPSNSDVGANVFTVNVSDGVDPAVAATLNITVVNTNDAPTFTVDPISGSDATEDAAYIGSLAGSASDDDGDALTYAKVSGPAWLSVATNGGLSGTPINSDVGANAFTVSVSDGTAIPVEATLDITVINTNDAPVFAADPFSASDAAEDITYSDTIASSASDDDGDALTYVKVSGPAWLSVAPNGDLSGTPSNADVGLNVFVVSVSDGTAAAVEASLNVTVLNTNDAPVFVTDPITGSDATEDAAYSGTIAGNALDDDGDALSYAKVAGPAWLSVAANGALSGTPTNSDVGANAFTVSVSDGTATPVEATLNITVVNVNDAPVFAADPISGIDATEDAAYVGSLAGSASDDDEDALSYAKVSGPAWLSVAANGDLSGTPSNSDVGASAFTVSVSDGTATPVEATLNITVVNVNDAPVFAVDPITGSDATEDAAYVGSIAGSASDDDEDALTYAKVSGPAWLSVAANGDLSGTPSNSDVGASAFTVSVSDGTATPVEATLNITVIASSGQIAVTNGDFESGYDVGWSHLTGDGVAVFSDETATPYQGAHALKVEVQTLGTNSWSIQSLGPVVSLTVGEEYSLTFWAKSAAAGTGLRTVLQTTTFTAQNHNIGTTWQQYTWTFTAQETDPQIRLHFKDLGTVWVDDFQLTATTPPSNTVPAWSSDPVNETDATEDALYTGTLSDNASDTDSDPLSYAKVSGPVWLSVAANGDLSGTPSNSDVGANVFTVSVSDGVDPAVEATLNITVVNTNDGPVFTSDPISGSDATEDAAYVGNLLGSASDEDGDALSYAKVSGPAWLSVAANGDLSGTPSNSDVGGNVFTVSVSDGTATPVEATLNITVVNVNDAPVFTVDPITGSDASEDEAYVGSLFGSASDEDGDALSYAKVSGPAWLSVAANGDLSGTPSSSDVGANAFTVSVSDGAGAPVQATLNITVNAAPSVSKLFRTTLTAVGNDNWMTVDLGQVYTSAVIVATPVLPNDTHPPVVSRLRNVSGSSFDLKVERIDGLTGSVSVDVHIVAVEEGVYTLANDGVTMEAVKYTSSITGGKNSWVAESQTYQNTYTNPVVVGQVMSANDANWSAFWCQGSSRTSPPDASNLSTGKQVAEDPNSARADEIVGYIVIESGTGSMDGINLVAGLGDDTIRGVDNSSTGFSYSFSGLSSASAAAVSLAAMDGADGGFAVLTGAAPLTSTSMTLYVEEDQLSDSERSHTTEQAGYLVLE